MNQLLFSLLMTAVIAGGLISSIIMRSRSMSQRFAASDTVAAPMVGTVATMFALFVAFGASEVVHRSRELRVAIQKEANIARSLFKFTESVGTSAALLNQSLIEYLQAATSREALWLEENQQGGAPSQAAADVLVQMATLFATQSTASETIKSLVVTKVDELRQARTQRLSFSRGSSEIAQWVGLTIMAVVAQVLIALTHVGKPKATTAALSAFSFAALAAMCYLAWIDGLIGPSKLPATLVPLREVLEASTGL